jgi:hypothetical protein
MSPFSVDAFALDELAEMLTTIANDQSLDHERRMQAVFAAFMVTPQVWPLDHTLFEALLFASGFDLHQPEVLRSAAVVGAQLEGCGHAPLACDHAGSTPLCNRIGFEHAARADAAVCARAGRYDELLNMRRLREVGLRWRAASTSVL